MSDDVGENQCDFLIGDHRVDPDIDKTRTGGETGVTPISTDN